MASKEIGNIPDLVVSQCLFGCNNDNCPSIWINQDIEHRIVCNCECNNHTHNRSHSISNEAGHRAYKSTTNSGKCQGLAD